jgi:hypothetical protein
VRTGRAFRIAGAIALLAATGCDFWNNLIEETTLTRANLEVNVVDAWTGEALGEAHCHDSLSGLEIKNEGNAAYRLHDAPTGRYAVRCSTDWYHNGSADLGLTVSGARITVKLARRGGDSNWYADANLKVRILNSGGALRYPRDLDWSATPADDSGRFLYEWSFSVDTQLNRGPWPPHQQAPKVAYSPRFQKKVSLESGIVDGQEKVTLKVYSLLHDPKQPELVGSDSMLIRWAANLKPNVRFNRNVFFMDSSHFIHPRWGLGCKRIIEPHDCLFVATDSDGQCKSIRLRAVNSPSLPGFDTLLSCEQTNFKIHLPLVDPRKKTLGDTSIPVPDTINADGAEEYNNTLIADIVDDNGDRGSDTVQFRTFRNSPPTATLVLQSPKTYYSVGDSTEVRVYATDPDGWFNVIGVHSAVGDDRTQFDDTRYMPNIPHDVNSDSFKVFINFYTPGKIQIWAQVKDDCEESFDTTPQPVQVRIRQSP